MLEPLLSEVPQLTHLDSFHFGIILDKAKNVGNILGELILAHSADLSPTNDYSFIHPFLIPLFTQSIFGYPKEHWKQVAKTSLDYEKGNALCHHIVHDKVYLCAKLWEKDGFTIPDKGTNDSIEAQLSNAERLFKMPVEDYEQLKERTQRLIYLSGMFGKNISLEDNFH